jgi:hypothetical protein
MVRERVRVFACVRAALLSEVLTAAARTRATDRTGTLLWPT